MKRFFILFKMNCQVLMNVKKLGRSLKRHLLWLRVKLTRGFVFLIICSLLLLFALFCFARCVFGKTCLSRRRLHGGKEGARNGRADRTRLICSGGPRAFPHACPPNIDFYWGRSAINEHPLLFSGTPQSSKSPLRLPHYCLWVERNNGVGLHWIFSISDFFKPGL